MATIQNRLTYLHFQNQIRIRCTSEMAEQVFPTPHGAVKFRKGRSYLECASVSWNQ